jgi:hypothetical protein
MIEKECKWYNWIAILIPLMVLSFSYFYMDTRSIIRCGIDVFKSLFDGRIGDYYAYAHESFLNGLMVHEPTYDFIFYLTIGIWELPLAIMEHVFSGKYYGDTMLAVVYSKCLLLIFTGLCAYMVYQIARELRITAIRAKWAAYMFLTSGFIYCYIGIAGQYDIIGMFFTLLGVRAYIKDDMKKFAILFIISVQYKFFPLFVFFPLLLLKEKDLRKIVAYLVGPIVTIVLFRLPFMNDGEAMLAKNFLEGEHLSRIFGTRLNLLDENVPLSLLVMGAVCIFCYFKYVPKSQESYYAVWIPLIVIPSSVRIPLLF